MSTIIIAAILVGSVAAICFFMVNLHNKHKREAMNNMLKHFSQLGTENGLSFSSQEPLHHCIIGIDGVKRKILVVTKEEDSYDSFIINLDEVKDCTVKKIYGTIKAGDLKNRKLEQYLEKIVLHFEIQSKQPAEIVFYQNIRNHVYQLLELEQRAKHWEVILSKMLKPLKNIV